MWIKDKHKHPINVARRLFIGKQLYNLCKVIIMQSVT